MMLRTNAGVENRVNATSQPITNKCKMKFAMIQKNANYKPTKLNN